MKRLIPLVLLLISSSLLADQYTLDQILDRAERLYLQGNRADNEIRSDVIPQYSFARRFPKAKAVPIENSSEALVAQQFKECVFLSSGSWEDHLTDQQAERMSTEMANFALSFGGIELYRIDTVNIFQEDGQTAPCVLGIKTKDFGGLLLMQGFFWTP